MKVLLTGAFGIVGREVLDYLIEKKYKVRIFEIQNKANLQKAVNYKEKVEIIWGDIRNKNQVLNAVRGIDAIIHLAAIIPPLADLQPELAYDVNVMGTKNLLEVLSQIPLESRPRLVYTSSISIYGDRRKNPLIKRDDKPNPNQKDHYAHQKLEAEGLIKQSELEWVIFRLTYIVSPHKLEMNPIMFDIPLDTKLEICHAKDAAIALVNAIENENIWGKILHIAGGKNCRTDYKQYLKRMFDIFGIGFNGFPEGAFSRGNFHCGYMETDLSQKFLEYQNYSLEDYYKEVKDQIGYRYYFNRIFSSLAKYYLLKKSEYYGE